MNVEFFKYQGTGNDFIIIDDREEKFDIKNQNLIAQLCERRTGIGADGLILLRNHSNYDFEMIYFNSDGKESSMCGNGARCIVAFAQSLDLLTDSCIFLAFDGDHKGLISDDLISIQMQDVHKIVSSDTFFILNTGSPHYVVFTDDISKIDVEKEGSLIRFSSQYQNEGINVNFVQVGKQLEIRTYERGVETETLSCGTGVVAAAISAHKAKKIQQSPILLKTQGGELIVEFQAQGNLYRNIWLRGPAELIFAGEFVC